MGIAKTFVTIGIALIFVFFVGYTVYTFYEEPKYEDSCPEKEQIQSLISQSNEFCVSNNTFDKAQIYAIEDYRYYGGYQTYSEVYNKDNNYTCPKLDLISLQRNVPSENIQKCTEIYTSMNSLQCTCETTYRQVMKKYNLVNFIILGIIGLIALMAGAYFISYESIGSGILGGGILTIIYSIIRFWNEFSKYLRLLVLFLALVILIWFAY